MRHQAHETTALTHQFPNTLTVMCANLGQLYFRFSLHHPKIARARTQNHLRLFMVGCVVHHSASFVVKCIFGVDEAIKETETQTELVVAWLVVILQKTLLWSVIKSN